ncbi:FtsK/SpoIIIE domain-containing protein [Amycolatopsis cihanbeyliensis]|uniref:S-DNA-T family DNA segregation ATPase FtsK/SpoIIIE n=1 Tax=Amycolatopsis cihanbeyliensis TaxID=1128664 RepID=A0A542DQR4_AMYCI|nr:FtsK/SpoIIIE domain-containing protein [Amycolatopsis cihanbeyliensis]TQJ05449.1 S-DNA-T family DNA segregation ATPase FtsK/SpoIIIE [Amycolatopsis cihanbeyliensis]
MGKAESGRRKGREVRTALWLGRHPGTLATPAAVTASGLELGWVTTGGVLGGLGVGLCGWYRAHPDTFDTWAAPRMRAFWRRWSRYVGRRWTDALRACDLYTVHRKTKEERFPRVLKVRSPSPSVDTVQVRIPPGQHARQWEAKLPELTEALKAERVAVERVKPRVIGLVIERTEPFTEVIDAPDMPQDTDAVDITDLYVGEDEYGGELRLGVQGGRHTFIAGATGAGKNSIPMGLLRGLAPLIRDGLVRLWICDPKQMEFSTLAPIAHRYATDTGDCVGLVENFVADMQAVQRRLSAEGQRKITVSRETPLNLLILDEIGALLAYGDGADARELRKLLALVGSQGRATGHSMHGLVQEPTKDTVPVRDLFTVRICLRVTSASHVDMVLGDGARLRGALADEIPDGEETAGIGYVIRPRSRVPMRFRSAYTTDAEIAELVAFVQHGQHGAGMDLRVVA